MQDQGGLTWEDDTNDNDNDNNNIHDGNNDDSNHDSSGDRDHDHDQDPDQDIQLNSFDGSGGSIGLRDISSLAKWTLSSWKEGLGVECLRDDCVESYWQLSWNE